VDESLLEDVRKLWRSVETGILSTTSVAVPGYPFGSVVPYVTTAEGAPVIYISHLAQHTKNLLADPRACLTVIEPAQDDAQAAGRISLLGDAAVVPEGDRDQVAELYFATFPTSRRFSETHGFTFWALTPKRVRFIGGFGRIHWIEAADWRA
jgi:putative heme iron utilization protein